MAKYGYLVVEGPHDVEFVYRLLRPYGFTRVRMEEDLDEYFRGLVPRSFPHDGDLQKRVPIPLFIASDTHLIAIHSAIGDTRLAKTIEETDTVVDLADSSGVGFIVDCDEGRSAVDRYAAIRDRLQSSKFRFPESPGTIYKSGPTPVALGGYVLPDNEGPGNLETLLIECAKHEYPNLLASARSHVTVASNDSTLRPGDGVDLKKEANFNKAVVGSIASVLRPGRAVQNSIQDNRWLRGRNLKLERIRSIQVFLRDLFQIEEPASV